MSQKILLIGAAGKQGQEYYELLKNDFFFSGLVDSNFDALELLYGNNENLVLYQDVESALTDIDFDVAIVCVPHDLHLEITLSLLNAHKTVIKEKPLALSESHVQHYKKSFASPKILTIVQRQYNPVFLEARDDLGLIGKIYNYRYEYSLYPKNLKNRFFGLSESSLESTTAGFASWSVLMQYEPTCDRRL